MAQTTPGHFNMATMRISDARESSNVRPSEQTDNLAVDDYSGDAADSAYNSEVASYTTSLASSVTEYKFVHGRRYHSYKEGSYVFPNDEVCDAAISLVPSRLRPRTDVYQKEKDRLDIIHKVVESIRGGKLFFAPLKDPKRALDIGTGTGIWAMEFGDQYPQCDVLGNDLSPIQPRWVPPNVNFEVDDAESEWTYSQKFDFIHSRSMNSAIHDWPKYVRQCYENLQPGGWVEFCDWDITWTSPDGSLKEDMVMHKVNREFIKAVYESGGADPCPGLSLEKWVREADFEEIKVWKCPAPFGTWPADKRMKEIGAWNYLQVSEGLEGLIYFVFTQLLGLSKAEVDVTAAQFRADLRNPRIHPLCHIYIVIGRKPESNPAESDGVS